ncbi:MAG: 3-deoxy-manno-octulosonate cytidylyltransferase [Crocinitomicaceae bacterium]
MKILAIIPARYDSSRFPGKPLIDIQGKSMIQRVYEQVKKAILVTDVIVATDDQRIYDMVMSFGGQVMMTSKDHQSGTDRCGEVITSKPNYDVIINVQGDEPLVQPSQIDEVLSLFSKPSVKIATLVKEVKENTELFNPNRIKVVLNDKNEALYFSRQAIPFLANTPKEKWLETAKFWKHIGIYAWTKNTLKDIIQLAPTTLEKQESLEQLRWLFHGYAIQTIETTIETPNIDTPEDLKKVLQVLNSNQN